MPKTNREEIEQDYIKFMDEIKHDKKTVKKVKEKMAEFKYLAGAVQGYIDDAKNEVSDMDLDVIVLMLESTYFVTKNSNYMPDHYFTEIEIQTARQHTGDLSRKKRISFPLTIENVFQIKEGVFSVPNFEASLIKELLDSLLLNYEFEAQREATKVKRKDQVIFQPTVNMANVEQMTELIVKDKLIPKDTLVFNAGAGTNRNGFEIDYDEEKHTLTILNGTKLDISDGYHRCLSIRNAFSQTDDINYKFPVLIVNYTNAEVQEMLGQMSNATPISKVRLSEFKQERKSDSIISKLRKNSELEGKISQTQHVNYKAGEIVNPVALGDAIDENFNIENKADEIDVTDYLTDFYDYLLGKYPDAFYNNIAETHSKSLLNDNNFVSAYVILAKRMQDEGIRFTKVKDILDNIDFSKDNKMWAELDIYKDGSLTKNARENIKKYFNEVEISGVVV